MQRLVMNKCNAQVRFCLIAAVVLGAVLIAGCSEDEQVAVQPDPSTVILSGVLTDGNAPISDALVTAFRGDEPGTPITVSDTDATGAYSVSVLLGVGVHLSFNKFGHIILNTQYESFQEDMSGLDYVAVTVADAETVIDTAFEGMNLDLADKAWLVVEVKDAGGDDVGGVTITPTAAPAGGGALNCDGTLTDGQVTVDPTCMPERTVPTYMAYFDADVEVSVAVTGSGDVSAPVRMGQVTTVVVEQ